jgi:hypothetical protein
MMSAGLVKFQAAMRGVAGFAAAEFDDAAGNFLGDFPILGGRSDGLDA